MSTLGDLDILDEPDALADCNCDLPNGTPHVCSAERQADGAISFISESDMALECEVCGDIWTELDPYGWCQNCRDDEDPSPMCNCETCPSGGPYTCVRED